MILSKRGYMDKFELGKRILKAQTSEEIDEITNGIDIQTLRDVVKLVVSRLSILSLSMQFENACVRNTLKLYKIKVNGSEMFHGVFLSFIIITDTHKNAVNIMYEFICSEMEYDSVPEYLGEKNLIIEEIANVENIEEKYWNTIIGYSYQD